MENENEDVLDIRVLGEMCAVPGQLDDPVLIGLIALFLREETTRLAELEHLAGARNGAALARIAHKLAGSCAVIGATQIYEAAQSLEREADAGAWSDVEARLVGVRAAWALLLATLARHRLVPKSDM